MKRLLLSALAATMLTVPVVTAQAAPIVPSADASAQIQLIADRKGPVVKKKVVREVERRDRFGRSVVTKRTAATHWTRGHRLPNWKRQHVVRDYHYQGLRRPARGQYWVKVNNDYLLIVAASGIIASVIAAN